MFKNATMYTEQVYEIKPSNIFIILPLCFTYILCDKILKLNVYFFLF